MAWNRPSETKVEVEGRGRQWNVHLKGLIAGMIVVIGAAVVAWWLWPSADRAGETPPPRKEPLIREVKPAAVKQVAVATTTLTDEEKVRLKFHSGNLHKYPPSYNTKKPRGDFREDSPEVAAMKQRVQRVAVKWKHGSEESLSGMISYEPGDMYIERDFTPEFMKDLIASLDDPIEIADDDPQLVVDRKREMMALKEGLKQIYSDSGADGLKKELEVAQRDLIKANQVVTEMQKAMNEALENGVDGQDLVDTEDAINLLLKSKGISSRVTSDYIMRLRRRLARKQGPTKKQN